MKKLKAFLSELFEPAQMNDLDVGAIGEAFNDSGVRAFWLQAMFEELKRLNLEVDRRLLSLDVYDIHDLCARRKAIQDVLEAIVSARRQVTQGVTHNPHIKTLVDLDRVTG